MSMPIQRQSEAYSIFDDGPRFARDRSGTDLPRGLAGLVNSMGPRITGGLLNTRTAVNTDGMHPDDHAYHTELPPGRGGEVTWVDDAENYGRNPRREWNPDFGYEPTDEDERRQEGVAEDDDSGYNWGPEPRRASRHPFDRAADARLAKDGGCTCWEGYERVPGTEPCASKSCRKKTGTRRVALAPQDPAMAPQVPAGGGFQPAHRVGLPWRDSVIPGTVIGLDGPSVAVRWDDGQYSIEEPHNIQLL